MMNEETSAGRDLRERTKQFAIGVIRLCRSLPDNPEGRVIANQLLRCGTAVGANYRAACRARSKAEFIAKMGVVEEEADESGFWMELIMETALKKPPLVEPLLQEANELTAIVASSVMTARANKSKEPSRTDRA